MRKALVWVGQLPRIDAIAVTDIRIAEVRTAADDALSIRVHARRACPLPNVTDEVDKAERRRREGTDGRSEEVSIAQRIRSRKDAIPRVRETASITLALIAPRVAPRRSATIARGMFPFVFRRQPTALARAELLCIECAQLCRRVLIARRRVPNAMWRTNANLVSHDKARALKIEVRAFMHRVDVQCFTHIGHRTRRSIERERCDVHDDAIARKRARGNIDASTVHSARSCRFMRTRTAERDSCEGQDQERSARPITL